ncbi:MAG: lytic murein transglycosylase, partial [Gammaproteobacteria bacterium]|nr:lytic murein transglycosylase [Gammaproteobacteria bacterium]
MKSIIVLIFSLLCLNTVAMAKPTWQQWVAELKIEAVSQGIAPDLFDRIFRSIPEPDHRVISFDKTQPEHRITFLEYRNTRADKYKIFIGRREYELHKEILEEIGETYHVDPCIVVALWGMESSYGHYTGHFSVIKSLATLAYDARRGERFRQELLLALQIVNQGQISVEKFKGEWAGASGQPQFLPSSWFKYAVDYDNDGRKDIWTSDTDSLASIANYLSKNGWLYQQPVVVQVALPDNFPKKLIGKKIKKTVSDWNELGVRTMDGADLSYPDLQASIIQLEGGPTFLIYNNFNVIMTYNYSSYYAATIAYLSDKICK